MELNDKDTPQSQPGWEREEQVLLVVEYFKCKGDRYLIAKSDAFLSDFLRLRAVALGREIGEKYRNVYGVQAQRENLKHFDPENPNEVTGHESRWMRKIVNEYLKNPMEIIYEAYEILKKYR